MSEPQTKVSVYQRGELIHESVLPPGEYVIDQQGAAQNCVPGVEIPGPHTKLQIDDKQWLVDDPGSLAGTMVDGETITVPTVIMPGQKIKRGDHEIVLDHAGDGWATEESRPGVTVRRPTNEEIRDPKNYDVGRVVARGGMGIIWSAQDTILQREVAMKLMLDGSKAESVARFYQEAQITAQLEHPNIVPVHELSLNEENQPFYTMKLVRGISLRRVLEGLASGDAAMVRHWPLSALLTVFQKVCDAIAFAHARGVIHRDLKPDNIMLGEYGEAQVMDWGLAKLVGQDVAARMHSPTAPIDDLASLSDQQTASATMSGTVIGTPQYMSPEQANGAVELMDERTDLYSLGAILYHILTLRHPFNGRGNPEVLRSVREGKIVPFAEACAGKRLPHVPGGRVPDSLAAVTLKAMALDKEDRYAAVKFLQNEIEAYQSGFATSAEHAGTWKLINLFLRRHRTISIAAALGLVGGVIFAINLARERDRATSASLQAQAARRIADEQRDTAEEQLYRSEMLQAGRHLADGRPESARELLRRHRNEPSGRDLRSWEWFYLTGKANEDQLHVQAHKDGVFALAVSADGSRIATGGGDGDVAVWQSRGLAPEFRLRASIGVVYTVAWHPDGKLLAAGGGDGAVRVWNVETQKMVAEYRLESGSAVRSIAWRPKEPGTPVLVIGGLDQEIRVWRPLASGGAKEPETFATTQHGVASLHWSADGQRLAVGELGTTNAVEVFAFLSGKKMFSRDPGSGNDALAVAVDPRGEFVAAGSKHLMVVVYKIVHEETEKELISSESLHRGFVSALAWSPDGLQLASASHDGTIRLAAPPLPDLPPLLPVGGRVPRTDRSIQILSGHHGEVNALAWVRLPTLSGTLAQSEALFSGGADGTLRAWTLRMGSAFDLKSRNWIAASNWNPAGTRLAVADFRDEIYLCDPSSGMSVPIRTLMGNVYDVAWSPGGDRLATASRGSERVETFDVVTGRSLGMFTLPNAYRVAWSPSGKYLAACGMDGARVWDVKTGTLLVVISRAAGCLTWHPDERRIILGGDNGAVELWDISSGKLVSTWRQAPAAQTGSVASDTEPPHQVFDLRWDPTKRFLAFSTQDSTAGVLDGHDGHLVRSFTGHTSGVWRVVWSADGRRLATAGQDGMIRVFDTESGGQVAHINHGLGNAELHGLDWNSEGRRLVSGGFDSYVRVWDAQRGERIDAVEQLANAAEASPGDVEILRKLAGLYTDLGWVGDARRVFAQAQSHAPEDGSLREAAKEAEDRFAHALDGETFHTGRVPSLNPRALAMLTTLQEVWRFADFGSSLATWYVRPPVESPEWLPFTLVRMMKKQGAEISLAVWRDLLSVEGSEEVMPMALSSFNRGRWSVTWFSSKVDPVADPQGWRSLAAQPEAVTMDVRLLAFPYLHRGPKDLLMSTDLAARGPSGKNFGMVARTKVNLPAGVWRCRVKGGGGARVLINQRPVIEKWEPDGAADAIGEYQQTATSVVEFTVEHFVTDGIDHFQFLFEPVLK